jgi:hypothetical protein
VNSHIFVGKQTARFQTIRNRRPAVSDSWAKVPKLRFPRAGLDLSKPGEGWSKHL